jgi:hypothetical protein
MPTTDSGQYCEKHETEIIELQRRMENVEHEIEKERLRTTQALWEIRDKLLSRPSWAVLVIITILCSSVGTLLAVILKH